MKRRIIGLFTALAILASASYVGTAAETVDVGDFMNDVKTNDTVVSVDLWDYTATENCASNQSEAGGEKGRFVYTNEEGSIEWKVNVPADGEYAIRMKYYTMGGKGASIVRNLYIDSAESPQGNGCVFSRAFENESEEISKDKQGNEIRSVQVEKEMWLTSDFRDPNGYDESALLFTLSKGIHTLRLEAVREPVLIGALELYTPEQEISYESYLSTIENKKVNDNIEPIYIQGEEAILKSDSMLYQTTDRSSSATQPSNAVYTVLNTIGGTNWSSFGQWLIWEVDVEQTGYYKVSMRAKQNAVAGQPSYRSLYISEKADFSELRSLQFPYSNDWELYTLGSEQEDYRFYLEAGTYYMKMEVVLGDMSDIIQRVETVMQELNDVYLSLLMMIGPTPDTYRDYQFETYLPEELELLKEKSADLEKIYDDYLQICATGGSQAQSLKNLAKLTNKMGYHPNEIASVFSEFSDSISSLGTWLTTARKQALEIDYICLSQYEDSELKAKGSFWSDLWFKIKQFFASFTNEERISKEQEGDGITVWVTSGRDQANTLIHMVDNYFTPESGIECDVQLVDQNTLLTAVLAGKGPDVALSLTQSLPVNYAIRGAVKDLTQFEEYEEVAQRFQPSALVPLSFDGAVYGLPETQSFYVMFYRTDVLEELGLSVPQTWDDVIAMIPVLNRNNMNFGLPLPMSTTASGVGFQSYAMFLYQKGGSFYTENGAKSLLDSEEAADAFKMWTDFYTQYSLPYDYNFQNRFRSGEVPIGIADYGTYNVLSVFAPELNGLWDFALVPGIEGEDGEINRSIAGNVTASVILEDTDAPESAWEFLKWWTEADTQEFYGREIESIMGTAGRYQTANIEALQKIPWSAKDLKVLLKQWEYTKGIPEVPGSYMTSRYLDFGFKQIILENTVETDAIQVLLNQNKRIQEEIVAKRKEFNLMD